MIVPKIPPRVLVTLSRVNNTEVTMDFQTTDHLATADSDYEEKSGTLFPLDGGTRGGSRNGPIFSVAKFQI